MANNRQNSEWESDETSEEEETSTRANAKKQVRKSGRNKRRSSHKRQQANETEYFSQDNLNVSQVSQVLGRTYRLNKTTQDPNNSSLYVTARDMTNSEMEQEDIIPTTAEIVEMGRTFRVEVEEDDWESFNRGIHAGIRTSSPTRQAPVIDLARSYRVIIGKDTEDALMENSEYEDSIPLGRDYSGTFDDSTNYSAQANTHEGTLGLGRLYRINQSEDSDDDVDMDVPPTPGRTFRVPPNPKQSEVYSIAKYYRTPDKTLAPLPDFTKKSKVKPKHLKRLGSAYRLGLGAMKKTRKSFSDLGKRYKTTKKARPTAPQMLGRNYRLL